MVEEQKKKGKNKMDLSGLHWVYKEEGHNKFILYLYIRLIICEEEHVLELLSAVEFLSPWYGSYFFTDKLSQGRTSACYLPREASKDRNNKQKKYKT